MPSGKPSLPQVRIEFDPHHCRIFINRSLLRLIDWPPRLQVRRDRGGPNPGIVLLQPCAPGLGYALTHCLHSQPRIALGRNAGLEYGLNVGTYEARVGPSGIEFCL